MILMLPRRILREPATGEPSGAPAAAVTAPEAPAASTDSTVDAGLAEAIQKGFEASQATAKPAPKSIAPVKEPPAPEVEEGTPEANGEAPEGEVEEAVEETNATVETPEAEKGPIPYERFQEVVHARQEAETRFKEMEPLVTAYRGIEEFCQTNQISQEEFSSVLEVLALSKHDPAAALAKFTPVIESWKSFTGDTLSPELKSAVEAGDITPAYAQKLQAAQNRADFAQRQSVKTAEQQQRAQQEAQTRTTLQSFASWLEPLQRADPTFKQGAPRFDLFLDRLRGLVSQTGAQTPQSIVKHAQDALDYVSKAIKPAPSVNGNGHRPSLRTNSSATSTSTRGVVPKFKTAEEAIAYGISHPRAALRG